MNADKYTQKSLDAIRIAQSMATHNSQEDVTVGEMKKKLTEHRHFLAAVTGIFRRKK